MYIISHAKGTYFPLARISTMIPPFQLETSLADPVTEGPAQWLSPSLPASKASLSPGEPIITECPVLVGEYNRFSHLIAWTISWYPSRNFPVHDPQWWSSHFTTTHWHCHTFWIKLTPPMDDESHLLLCCCTQKDVWGRTAEISCESIIFFLSLSFFLMINISEGKFLPYNWSVGIFLVLCELYVRVQPCILNSALFQCISNASPKLLHVLWCIAHWTLHATQLHTTPCICASAHATSTCLFICLFTFVTSTHVVCLFVCFPFWIVSVNWWAVDQC